MKKVHRRLGVTTPYASGEDVKELQVSINATLRKFRIDLRVKTDGEFGPATLRGARVASYLLGANGMNRKRARQGVITRSTQGLVRGRKRTRFELSTALARKPRRAQIRKRYDKAGGQRAIALARKQIGVTENPAGSNWGPKVGEYITYTGYTFPVFWCGCFVAWCVGHAGAKIPKRIRLGYTGYITADANAGDNGLIVVPFDAARAGDIVVYSFDHIGLVESVDGDILTAIEGNTSSGSSGSQSNGGGVYRRTRSRSDVVTIARPAY